MGLLNTLKHSWNTFTSRDPTYVYKNIGPSFATSQDKPVLSRGKEKTIISSIYTRIAVDVASVTLCHARVDDQKRFLYEMPSKLNDCLTLEANIDQTNRNFIIDVVISLFDEGNIAIIPTNTSVNVKTGSFDIEDMRVGQIIEWYPKHVRVRAYNELTGLKEEIIVEKKNTAIIENPFYTVMNTPNSTLQRLIRKLAILDEVDEHSRPHKLDIIFQSPYMVRNDRQRENAKKRIESIEDQIKNSPYGIAYADSAEKIIQLNRPIDNKLLEQIQNLTETLYSQLGITKEVMNGTADEKTMVNYYNRTIEPILSAIADEMKRKFLTKTARTQKQTILFFRDPFKLAPIGDIAEIADKFTRNEVLSANEVRQIIGRKPSDNPAADDLRNRNIIATENGNIMGDGTEYNAETESIDSTQQAEQQSPVEESDGSELLSIKINEL